MRFTCPPHAPQGFCTLGIVKAVKPQNVTLLDQ